MSFLPKGDKEPPKEDNYTKFIEGETKFRVLSSAITGYEEFIDKKPVRYTEDTLPAEPHDEKNPIKFFWAFVVWNYTAGRAGRLQIMKITQKSIRKAIRALIKSESWGDPHGYDIIIAREGEGLETEYHVSPVPPKPLSSEIESKFKASNIDLQVWMEGGDPFKKNEDVDPNSLPDDL